jgi:MoaA/NifB/PqqE/SkfB family radical SAM enzyme
MLADKFVWDLTYACPLLCVHCYSESGRRPAKTLPPEELLRIADVIIRLNPKRVALSGGEPLLVRGWSEAARRLREAGAYVTLYTSGWIMNEALADELARSVTSVCVSIDGATEATHDRLRRRPGSYRKARAALELLARFKRERTARGEACYSLGTDFTVMRSNSGEMARVVEDVTASYPGLDYLRFGMAVPEGPAAEEDFAERELLTHEEMLALNAAEGQLRALARNDVKVSVTDMRYYIPYSPYGGPGETIAHIEPDGQLRAFGVYEAKVGNVLHEPFEILWSRALAWRNEPFVAEQIKSIQTNQDWARVARVLDRRYGSEEDKARIALRTAGRDKALAKVGRGT